MMATLSRAISSTSSKPRVIAVTLDAFGTLYHPREPIAVQYLKVAEKCGLPGAADRIKVPDLEQSFRASFKDHSARYPNYGKTVSMTPEQWWERVVRAAFTPMMIGGSGGGEAEERDLLPPTLSPRLYQHFASKDAYALYPDVLPFLESMRELKLKYQDPQGPAVLVGIITNSDDRVRSILESHGLGVGLEWVDRVPPVNPLQDWHYGRDDFDYLVASYHVGQEKPDRRIFQRSAELAAYLARSSRQHVEGMRASEITSKVDNIDEAAPSMISLHVGDDFRKDYQGAMLANIDYDALHLARDSNPHERKEYEIGSLEELSAHLNSLTALNFSK